MASPNGEKLAVMRATGLEIWDAYLPNRSNVSFITGWPICFSQGSASLATVDRDGVNVWDLPDRQLLRKFHENKDELDRVTCVQLSPDGDTVAVRCDEGLRLYSLMTGEEKVILPEYLKFTEPKLAGARQSILEMPHSASHSHLKES
jgi:WD40 repeat protein